MNDYAPGAGGWAAFTKAGVSWAKDQGWTGERPDEVADWLAEFIESHLSSPYVVHYEVESRHHILGTSCLCGFESFVKRDMTKHIVTETLIAAGLEER